MSEDEDKEKARAEKVRAREEKWDRENDFRSQMLQMQYDEMLILHAEFPARNARQIAAIEACIVDHVSVVEHRKQIIEVVDKQTAAVEKQTAVFERIAAALEKRSP